MRRLLPLVVLAAGCQDYGKLQEGFCVSALKQGYSLCDDFENDALDAEWSPNITGGGALVTEKYKRSHLSYLQRVKAGIIDDPGYAYRGRGTLHATLPPDVAADAQLDYAVPASDLVDNPYVGKDVVPVLDVRFFFWVGDSVTPNTFDLVRFVDGAGVVQRTVSMDHGAPRITDIASNATQVLGAQLFPSGWHCMEVNLYEHKLDVIADSHATYELDLSLAGLTPLASVSSVQLGPSRPAQVGSVPVDLWLDEAIIVPGIVPLGSVGCEI